MKLLWQIEESDINKVKALIAKYEAHPEIKRRRNVNSSDNIIDVIPKSLRKSIVPENQWSNNKLIQRKHYVFRSSSVWYKYS